MKKVNNSKRKKRQFLRKYEFLKIISVLVVTLTGIINLVEKVIYIFK